MIPLDVRRVWDSLTSAQQSYVFAFVAKMGPSAFWKGFRWRLELKGKEVDIAYGDLTGPNTIDTDELWSLIGYGPTQPKQEPQPKPKKTLPVRRPLPQLPPNQIPTLSHRVSRKWVN